MLSFIVPALDEAAGITAALSALQPLRHEGHEVLVVDGGSEDATADLATPLADCVLRSERGRAVQQNAGARAARGEVLVFVHADTRLPSAAAAAIVAAVRDRGWGRFDVTLSGRAAAFRVIERMISVRSRLTGIATGDQALFVRRDWFQGVGGFEEIPLMEDVALCRRLLRRGPPACLRDRVTTSSRRWERRGVVRTVLLMWWLRGAYRAGVSPSRLARWYR